MDIHEAAKLLNGSQYREEGSRQLFADMKTDGLVAVFGASDDLIEFRGAINDEAGAPGKVAIGPDGLLESECDEGADCPYFQRTAKAAPTIKAIFNRDGLTFVYETDIPHATFVVNEDDETYCRGIVFALADLAPAVHPLIGKAAEEGAASLLMEVQAECVAKHQALVKARDQFAFYAKEHRTKAEGFRHKAEHATDPMVRENRLEDAAASDEKAKVNEGMVAMCDLVLKEAF